jgi:hypothetical protein
MQSMCSTPIAPSASVADPDYWEMTSRPSVSKKQAFYV